MNKTGFQERKFNPHQTILFNDQHFLGIGVQVGNTGVEAGADGRKVIKAGTPLGSTDKVLEDRKSLVYPVKGDEEGVTVHGVLMYDVDVTAGTVNNNLIIWGFIDLDKVEATIDEAAKTALAGKVTFIKGV